MPRAPAEPGSRSVDPRASRRRRRLEDRTDVLLTRRDDAASPSGGGADLVGHEHDGRQPLGYGQGDQRFEPAQHGRGAGRHYGQSGGPGMAAWPPGAATSTRVEQGEGLTTPTDHRHSDEHLKARLRQRLRAIRGLADANAVAVEVADSRVVLEGTVPTRRVKLDVEDLAERLGAREITNNLRILAPTTRHRRGRTAPRV